MPFTPEELAELAAFDAEIDAEFEWTNEELRESRARDKEICFERKESKARKIAEAQRAYYEANREKIAEAKRAYYEANREKIAEAQRAYREANREHYNAYMREYMRRKSVERKVDRDLQRI